MTRFGSIPSVEQIVDALVDLSGATKSDPMIVAGSYSPEVFMELHRRGYLRMTTDKLCNDRCAQFDVTLVVPRQHEIKALETMLDKLERFLCDTGVLVVWVATVDRTLNQMLRQTLKKLDFRIEAGTLCASGIAIAARRVESRLPGSRHATSEPQLVGTLRRYGDRSASDTDGTS